MTNRCRILVVAGILGLWIAVLRNQSALACLSLAVLVWIFIQWIVFEFQLWYRWPKYEISRQISGRPSLAVTSLHAGRPFAVELEINAKAGAVSANCFVRDLLPDNLILNSGSITHSVSDGLPLIRFTYNCICPSAGKTNFFGLHFQFRDAYGLFLAERVHRQQREFRVLPTFGQVAEMRPAIKRVNSVPQHGIHQLRRAGLGSELRDLREYQPGDPPKSIAWKVTARRGKLMTRQYESEVPVRLTIFLDAGGNVRSGKLGDRPLDRLTSIAAGIAKAAVSVGDAVGIILIHDSIQLQLRPANGDRAFYRVLESLSEFSTSPASATDTVSVDLLNFAVALARQRYPDLLVPRLYDGPFHIFPLWPGKRKQLFQKRQLAAVLAEVYELSPSQLIELVHDERTLARMLLPWLASMGCGSSFMQRESNTSTSVPRFELLAKELARAVAYAHDNELFVVMADLQATDQELESLFAATKVALSRHHRVTFICTSPLPNEGNFTPPKTIDDVYAQLARMDGASKAKSLRRSFRRIGAKFAFAHESSVVAAVMAEAELAGSGRFVARSAMP